MAHPPFVQPMKATAGTLPTDEGWAFEMKWDGMRIQASLAHGRVQLRSGSGRIVTSSFPELSALGDHLGINAVLDGEMVVFEQDRPSFLRLQRRMHVLEPSPNLLATEPVIFLAFDLLHLDGRSTAGLPYLGRRNLLLDLVGEGPNWRVPPHLEGEGEPLLQLAKTRNLEGVIAKRTTSRYHPARRSPSWIKVKIRRRQEFVVGGWLPGEGGLQGSIGSLLVGVQDSSGLAFAGAVGSGLTDQIREVLLAELRLMKSCPFATTPALAKQPSWVEPTMVIEVAYAEWEDGHHLRHPTYVGVRPDKAADTVLRDTLS